MRKSILQLFIRPRLWARSHNHVNNIFIQNRLTFFPARSFFTRLRCPLFVMIISGILLSCQSPTPETLQSQFKDPPVTARPKAFWTWANGNTDLAQLSLEIREAKEKGMGGYDIWDVGNLADLENKVPAGPAFMGEESVEAIVHAIKEATDAGLELGLVVASSWNNGGSWIEPEHGVMGIFDTTVIVRGGKQVEVELPFPALPDKSAYNQTLLLEKDANGLPTWYKEIAVLAVPHGVPAVKTEQMIELTDRYQDGMLTCELPEGEWEITRYVSTGLGIPLKRPSPNSQGLMIDHFSREAQDFHLQYFIDRLGPHFGNDFSNTALKYLYNDSYEIKGPVWTPKMPEEFLARNGYEITRFLPVLQGNIVDSKEITQRFLYDYSQTLSDLMIENHYRYGVEFCGKYGLGYYAEGGGPGPPVHEVPVESIKALGSLTVPRGEFWHKYPKYDKDGFNSHLFVKGIASAAHLYDQVYVEAESFTSLLHWQSNWSDLKPSADEAFCDGLNRVVFHTGTHQPPVFGMPGYVYGFGSHVNIRQTWWPKVKAWNDYLGRCSFMLQQGNFVGDILYFYGDTAPNFAKQRHIFPGLGFGYDYDVINTEKLLELEVQDGRMTLPHGQEYALLVLPDKEDMPLEVLQKIEQLLQAGALVSGRKPVRTPGLYNYEERDRQLQELANRLWEGLPGGTQGGGGSANATWSAVEGNGSVSGSGASVNGAGNGFDTLAADAGSSSRASAAGAGDSSIALGNGKVVGKGRLYSEAPLRDILYSNEVYPDFHYKPLDDSTDLNFIHRRSDSVDIYFVRNRRNLATSAECVFRVSGRKPELWIPETGKVISDLVYTQEGDSTRVALSFEPNDAYFILFRKPASEQVEMQIKEGDRILFPSPEKQARLAGYNVKLGRFSVPGDYKVEQNGKQLYEIASGEPDVMAIEGTWNLRFPEGYGAPTEAKFDELISWTESENRGIKYFSGIATYEIEFTLEQLDDDATCMLDLGEVKDLADVRINGEPAGTVWHAPFTVDVNGMLKKGTNTLEVDVVNGWNNRLVGDDDRPLGAARITNTNIVNGPTAWKQPWRTLPLKTSGLLGPVKLLTYE